MSLYAVMDLNLLVLAGCILVSEVPLGRLDCLLVLFVGYRLYWIGLDQIKSDQVRSGQVRLG